MILFRTENLSSIIFILLFYSFFLLKWLPELCIEGNKIMISKNTFKPRNFQGLGLSCLSTRQSIQFNFSIKMFISFESFTDLSIPLICVETNLLNNFFNDDRWVTHIHYSLSLEFLTSSIQLLTFINDSRKWTL